MDPDTSRLFPRDLYGRIALAIASLFFLPLGLIGAYTCMFRAQPKGVIERLTCFVVGELFVALVLFFGCGLIWALMTPRWLEHLLGCIAKRLIIALVLFMLPFGIMALWALTMG
jgi:hypothetical protein